MSYEYQYVKFTSNEVGDIIGGTVNETLNSTRGMRSKIWDVDGVTMGVPSILNDNDSSRWFFFKTTDGGETWVETGEITNPEYGNPEGCAYGNGVWAVVGGRNSNDGAYVWRSVDDGATWTKHQITSYRFRDPEAIWFCEASGLFVVSCTSISDTNVYTSPDGVTWTSRYYTVDESMDRIGFDGQRIILLGEYYTGAGIYIHSSADGITWEKHNSITGWERNSPAVGENGIAYMVSYIGSTYRIQKNTYPYSLANWETVLETTNTIQSIAKKDSMLAYMTNSTSRVLWSFDEFENSFSALLPSGWYSVQYGLVIREDKNVVMSHRFGDFSLLEMERVDTIRFPDNTTGTEFILSTQQPDLGYGSADRKIFNKGLSISPINYQIDKTGLQKVQNCSISFSNVENFYHQMRELNGADFWIGLGVDVYWANGRVPTLAYDGADWKEDGETLVSFTPTTSYPLTDSIKKEFSGFVSGGSSRFDTTNLQLVSQEKQDSYLIGTINSARGADSSQAKITPILIGDLTDDGAYVPLVLNNNLYNVPSGLCSDIDLSEQPTIYVYDDEAERYHVVNNKQVFLDNRTVSFYDASVSDTVVASGAQVNIDGKKDENTFYRTEDGEAVYRFSNNINLIPLENILGGYSDYRAYIQNYTKTYQEGTRNYDKTTSFSDTGEKTVNPLDSDIISAKALMTVSYYPEKILNVFDNYVTSSDTFLPKPRVSGGSVVAQSVINTNMEGTGPQPNASAKMECAGSAKGVIDFRDFSKTNYPHHDVTKSDNTTYLQFSPSHGPWNNNVKQSDFFGLWEWYNYKNFGYQMLKFEWSEFKFSGDIKSAKFYYNGGMGGHVKLNEVSILDPVEDSTTLSWGINFSHKNKNDITLNSEIAGDTYNNWGESFDSSIAREIKYSLDVSNSFDTLEDFKNSEPRIVFGGDSMLEPNKDKWESFGVADYEDGEFFKPRFFMDGVKFDIDVSAIVESKYWCFKGKTGSSVNLGAGLQQLADRYTNSNVTVRNESDKLINWEIAGAHIKSAVYYRDLLSKISDEFRVFITDNNGSQEVVAMGSDFDTTTTINESNILAPFNKNITYSETSSSEIYNKIVVRYAINHMTGNYTKTLEITSSGHTLNTEASATATAPLESYQSELLKADSFLSKINISEKTKRVDLDWVRDDFTAIRIAGWWCKNASRQRAIVSATVSKRLFLDSKIGDSVKLDLPELPIFYKAPMQIKKIKNQGTKYELELEEYV